MLDLKVLGDVSDTALTSDKAIEFEKNGLPNTFVPGRNLLFFTFAATIAYRRDLHVLVGGVCETDFSGYPDCRNNTLQALQVAMSLRLDQPLIVETPLMWIDKAKTWKLAESLGATPRSDHPRRDAHLLPRHRSNRHAWGYGCGSLPACALRKQGYVAFSAGDAK